LSDLSKRIADGLIALGPRARQQIEAATRAKLAATSASTVLTFVTPSGRRLEPAPSVAYISALWSFTRNQLYEGETLDSALSQPIAETVQSALQDFLGSEAAHTAIATAVGGGVGGASQSILSAELTRVAKEVFDQTGLSPKSVLEDLVVHTAHDQAVNFLHSAAGKALLAALSKTLVTAVGKIAVYSLVKAAAVKAVSSVAFKSLIVAVIKKIGLLTIAKAAVIKLLAIALPAVVVAKIPIFWVLLPLVVAFLAYEMHNMPGKLSKELPPQIGEKLQENWPEIAKATADHILLEAMRRAAEAAH
jgi:hypothetical protein